MANIRQKVGNFFSQLRGIHEDRHEDFRQTSRARAPSESPRNFKQASNTSFYAECAAPETRSQTEEDDEEDIFKGMNFNDPDLIKEEERHKKNLEKLDEDFRRRMHGLENIRKRKMEHAYQVYEGRKEEIFGIQVKNTYSDDYKHRGYCLIVQNTEEHEQSVEKLKKYFASNGYSVKHKKNLDEREMLTLLDYVSQKDFSDYGSFVSFVFSPGTEKYVATTDKKQVDMATIVEIFNTREVLSLKDKPKMFFFQSDIDILNATNVWKKEKGRMGITSIMPNYPDVFLLRSTLRDFAKNFTDCLVKSPRKTLNEVLETVARYTMPLASDKEQYEITSTLTKEVYLGKQESML